MFRLSEQSLKLEANWVKRVERWIEPKRGADVGELELVRKRIYILPTRAGLMFAVILIMMGITSINYKLSLGYAMVFLLGGLAWVTMFSTFGNLHRLVLIPGKIDSVFAGELAPVTLTIKNPQAKERYSVRLYATEFVKQALVDIDPHTERNLRFALRTTQRGWLPLPRMTVDTVFPLGLWRAWCRWQPADRVLVYPEPEHGQVPLPETFSGGDASNTTSEGHEDIAAIRPYRLGDNPRQIAWKAMARNPHEELLTKQFDGGSAGELVLDWLYLPGHLNVEAKISRLTRWVIDADAAGIRYALNLPDQKIEADQGPAHCKQCLTALALLKV